MISRCRDSRVAVGRLPPPPRLNYPPEAHHHWLQVTKCACTSVLFVSTGHGSGGGGRGSYHVHRAESSVLTTDQSTPALTIITRADTWDTWASTDQLPQLIIISTGRFLLHLHISLLYFVQCIIQGNTVRLIAFLRKWTRVWRWWVWLVWGLINIPQSDNCHLQTRDQTTMILITGTSSHLTLTTHQCHPVLSRQ